MQKSGWGKAATIVAAGLLISGAVPVPTWGQTAEQAPAATSEAGVRAGEQQRLQQLELAVQPTSAEGAVELFVKSHEMRNGALLYAILSPEERKRSYGRLAEQNWVLGVSSPWVKGYRIAAVKDDDPDEKTYTLQLMEYTSTGFMGTEAVTVAVKRYGDRWLIERYTPVSFATNMDLRSETLRANTVLGLVAEAQRRFWYIANGGRNTDRCPPFKPEGFDRDYRLLSEDIGTREALTAYLQEIFADDAVAAYFADQFSRKMLIEAGGRLAQPDGDWGSLRDWGRAGVQSLAQAGHQATATLRVPLGDSGTETVTVRFAYLEQKGWRIVTPPQVIR